MMKAIFLILLMFLFHFKITGDKFIINKKINTFNSKKKFILFFQYKRSNFALTTDVKNVEDNKKSS